MAKSADRGPWRVDGHEAVFARDAASCADADVLILSPSTASRVRLVPGSSRTVRVVPGEEAVAPAIAKRAVARAVAELNRNALGIDIAAGASALDAVRVALHTADRPQRVVVHAHDPAGRVARWLSFRVSWPRWWSGAEPPPHASIEGALALARRDERFRDLVLLGGPPLDRFQPSTFATIARAIVFQQLSGQAATTIWNRLADRLGGTVDPDAVLRAPMPRLREAGLSAAKAAAIRDLAHRVADGSLNPRALARLPDDEVIERLTQVRGIGPWSAQMHLLFSLGRPDVWPVLDLGVRKGIARWFHLRGEPDAARLERWGKPLRPWRSTAAWYAWRALEVPAPLVPVRGGR